MATLDVLLCFTNLVISEFVHTLQPMSHLCFTCIITADLAEEALAPGTLSTAFSGSVFCLVAYCTLKRKEVGPRKGLADDGKHCPTVTTSVILNGMLVALLTGPSSPTVLSIYTCNSLCALYRTFRTLQTHRQHSLSETLQKMLSLTLATLALGAVTSSILPALSAPTESAVPLTFSYVSTQGRGNTNLSLVEGDYGYAMQESSVPATISAYVGDNTLTMACPYPGLQAALIPADDGVNWNFQWVDGSNVDALPQGSTLDAFSVGGRATWADTTGDATVNTTVRSLIQVVTSPSLTLITRSW